MRRLKRGVHLDFHTLPGIDDFQADWDPAEFAQTLQDAHVECINVFAQCNKGFSYYPTKVGIPYPGLKEDMLEGIIRECHARDILVMGYISTGLNHEQCFRHPEWCVMDEEGRIIWGDRMDHFCRMPCYNTGYREYLLEVVKEVLTYDVDGLFFDNVNFHYCYCNTCTEKMMEQGIDMSDKSAVERFSLESSLAFAAEVKKLIPEGKTARFNGLGVPPQLGKHINTHTEIECLPSGGWGYDSFGAGAAYFRNIHEDVIYMTGRFQAGWGDFGGFKTKASMENDFYDALVAGLTYSMGDHMHPRCRLDGAIYETLKEINEELMPYETWTDNSRYHAQVAAVVDLDVPGKPALTESYKGLARMLGELKITFDIINEEMDFNGYEALILPDEVTMTETLQEKLSDYLAQGGKILSTGESGLNEKKDAFALPAWDFLSLDGFDRADNGYYRRPGARREITWSTYIEGILMKTAPEYLLAEYVKSYYPRHYDGRHGYYYSPPKESTGHAAAAGNGTIEQISFKVFKAYFYSASKFHKDLVREALERLLPGVFVKAQSLPSTARIGLLKGEDYLLLPVKVTYPEPRGAKNIIEEHIELPAGKEIGVRGCFGQVCLLPGQTPVKSRTEDGYTYITLPGITGFAMLMLKE